MDRDFRPIRDDSYDSEDDEEPGYQRRPSKRIANQNISRDPKGPGKSNGNGRGSRSDSGRPLIEGFSDDEWDELERVVTSILKWKVTDGALVESTPPDKLSSVSSQLHEVIRALKKVSRILGGRRRPGVYANNFAQDSLMFSTSDKDTTLDDPSAAMLHKLNRMGRRYGRNHVSAFAMRVAATIQRLTKIQAAFIERRDVHKIMPEADLEKLEEEEEALQVAEPDLWSAEEWRLDPTSEEYVREKAFSCISKVLIYDQDEVKDHNFTLKREDEFRGIMTEICADRGNGEDVENVRFLYRSLTLGPTDSLQSGEVEDGATLLLWIAKKKRSQ